MQSPQATRLLSSTAGRKHLQALYFNQSLHVRLICRGQNGEEIPQDAVQALDIALKHTVSYRDDVKTFARAIFWHDPTKVRPLGNGAEAGHNPLTVD